MTVRRDFTPPNRLEGMSTTEIGRASESYTSTRVREISVDLGQMEWCGPPSLLGAMYSAEPMGSEGRTDLTAPVPRLNCYFLQKDFDMYKDCGSCNGKGFECHTRLNEHIKRHHVNPDKPTTIETAEQLDDNLKRRAENLQEQKEKEKERRKEKETNKTRKKKECPKELSSQQFYKIFGKQGQLATKDSLGSIWLDVFGSLFHDGTASARPFKPYMEQILFHARHPSPELKAWGEKHHRLGSTFESQLGVIPTVVNWLSLTGGLPLGSGAGVSSLSASFEERATQLSLEETNERDDDYSMEGADGLPWSDGGENGDMSFYRDMVVYDMDDEEPPS